MAAPPDSAPMAEMAELAVLDSLALEKRFWLAAFEVTAANAFIWSFNRYIREGGGLPDFMISVDSVKDNMKSGFEWDDNNFLTNQFAHPYQGALYYNAARANGFDFWESIPFAFMGSHQWEYVWETHHPSINDWISTSVGGVALGEIFYRLSSMVLDNSASGSGRSWRELGGFAINPVRGFNRLVTGEAFRVHANPPDRYPDHLGAHAQFGLRYLGDERVWQATDERLFLRFVFHYGDPFETEIEKPFDVFEFGFQMDFQDEHPFNRIAGRGLLHSQELSRSEGAEHRLSSQLNFDYLINSAYEYGEQSVGASFQSRFRSSSHGASVRTALYLNAILLGATKSDYPNFTGRDYDYGSGFGSSVEAVFSYSGRDFLRLSHQQHLLHILNGNRADHYLSFARAQGMLHLSHFLGLGLDYTLYLAERRYVDYPDVSQRSPEIRFYFTWNLE